MPYAPEVNGQPGLPFSGALPLSRQASYEGAKTAQPTAGIKREAIYRWLLTHGPATDRQIAEALGMLISAVCGRRNELVQLGRVKAAGLVPGKFRARNTAWEAQ